MFKFAERAKAWCAFTGAVLTAVMGSTGFVVVPEPARPYLALVLSVATAVATYGVRNRPAPRPRLHADPPSPLDPQH
jgi:peptidoglycan/LPS O-acetylase OafA/YrhL